MTVDNPTFLTHARCARPPQVFKTFTQTTSTIDVGTFNDVMSLVPPSLGVPLFSDLLPPLLSKTLIIKGLALKIIYQKDGALILDTHGMSVPSSLIALRYALSICEDDLIVVVGKGKGSGEQVVGKSVINFAFGRGGECRIEKENSGRIWIGRKSVGRINNNLNDEE